MTKFLREFTAVCFVFIAALPGLAAGQRNAGYMPSGAYSNPMLGFRYVPPGEMEDETASGRAKMRVRATERHTINTLELLLSMSSGADDRDSSWHSLTIETYPRQKFSDLDDASAEAKMTAWVAGTSSLPEKPRSAVLAGQSFTVFVFARQEGTIKKGAVVWTTIRKDKLLSFAFVANSPEQLKKLTESMKSVQFY